MKKIALLCVLCFLLGVLNCCAKDSSNDAETTTVFEHTFELTTEELNEYIENVELETERITTTHPVSHAPAGEMIIDDGEYRYKISKTDFEKRFDEELLLQLSEMIPMGFGYEDYDKWDSSADVILNDVLLGNESRIGYWIERYDFESKQAKKAQAEMMSYSEENKFHEYFVTDISKINEYLIKLFGPNAGVIDKGDFEEYSVIANSEKHPFADFGYKYNYRFCYLPESKLVVCGINEFGDEETRMPYMCDVKEKDGLYIVRAVSGSFGCYMGNYNFLTKQNHCLENLRWYTKGYLEEWIYTIAIDDNGNMYMKSTEISYILPENAEKNYYAVSDAEIKNNRYSSDEFTVIGTLSKNEKFYSPIRDFEGRKVVTESYIGFVDEDLVEEIK